jgi:hypothetical protein
MICGKELHIHVKPNRSYVKKIQNKCEHVEEVKGGRVKDMEGIIFKTDKKKKRKTNKKGGDK